MTGSKPKLPFAVGELVHFKSDEAAERCMEGLTKDVALKVVRTGLSVIRCQLPTGIQILIDSWEFNDLEKASPSGHDEQQTIARDERFLYSMIDFALMTNDEKLFNDLTNELKTLKEGTDEIGGTVNDL